MADVDPARRAALVSSVVAAMRATREHQAGMAFGVPSDARDQYDEAIARAGLVALEREGVALGEVQGMVGILSRRLHEVTISRDEALADLASAREHTHICSEIIQANGDLGEALTLARREAAENAAFLAEMEGRHG